MLAVEAAMQLRTPGFALDISGEGSLVTCRVRRGFFNLFEVVRAVRPLLDFVRMLAPLLVRTGLRVEFHLGSTCLGRTGAGVAPNGPARLLRLPSTRIGP